MITELVGKKDDISTFLTLEETDTHQLLWVTWIKDDYSILKFTLAVQPNFTMH